MEELPVTNTPGSARPSRWAMLPGMLGVILGGCATVADLPVSEAVPKSSTAAMGVDASVTRSLRHFELDHALERAVSGLEYTGEDAAWLAWLGRRLRARGFANAALSVLTQVTVLRPDDAGAWLACARAAFTKGHIDTAIAACRAALVLQPDLDEARVLLERSLRRRKAR